MLSIDLGISIFCYSSSCSIVVCFTLIPYPYPCHHSHDNREGDDDDDDVWKRRIYPLFYKKSLLQHGQPYGRMYLLNVAIGLHLLLLLLT